MIKIFDYTFYRIAFLFRQISVVGDINSITIISIVETFNVLTITNIVFNNLIEKNTPDIYKLFLVALLFVILNSIRYLKFKKYHDLKTLWKDEEKKSRLRRGVLILVYIVLSLVFYVIS